MTIRPIRPDDGPRLQDAYDALSEESKYRRFLAAKPHLTSADTRYLVEVDGRDHVALVATAPGDPDRILGVARFVRHKVDPGLAELAIVVGDPFQHEGLGTELLAALAGAATERGIRRFKGTILAENRIALRLVRGSGAVVQRRPIGSAVNEMVVELAA